MAFEDHAGGPSIFSFHEHSLVFLIQFWGSWALGKLWFVLVFLNWLPNVCHLAGSGIILQIQLIFSQWKLKNWNAHLNHENRSRSCMVYGKRPSRKCTLRFFFPFRWYYKDLVFNSLFFLHVLISYFNWSHSAQSFNNF